MDYKKRYYRARGIAEFILEGNSLKDAANEFRISSNTATRELKYLADCDYGDAKENLRLYNQVQEEFTRQRIENLLANRHNS